MNALMLASYFLRNLNLDGRSAHRVRTSNFVPSHSAWCRARNLSILTVTFVGLLCATSLATTTSDQSTAPELARSRIAPPVLKNVAVHPALRGHSVPQEFTSDASKVTLEQRPNGVRLYRLNGQSTQMVTAHVGADGKVQTHCTDAAAAAALSRANEDRTHEK